MKWSSLWWYLTLPYYTCSLNSLIIAWIVIYIIKDLSYSNHIHVHYYTCSLNSLIIAWMVIKDLSYSNHIHVYYYTYTCAFLEVYITKLLYVYNVLCNYVHVCDHYMRKSVLGCVHLGTSEHFNVCTCMYTCTYNVYM